MAVYFAWIATQDEPFNAATHLVRDLNPLSLTFSEAEGEFARVELEVENPGLTALLTNSNRWALISLDLGAGAFPWFRGRLKGLPGELGLSTVTLELVAEPDDLADTYETLLPDALPFVDPLFGDDLDADPTSRLEATGQYVHVRASDLDVALVPAEAGTITHPTPLIPLADGVSLTYGDPPVKDAKIRLVAEWTQTRRGSVDISGPGGLGGIDDNSFNSQTYTPDTLVSSLPGPGGGVGDASGWTVKRAEVSTSFEDVTVSAAGTEFPARRATVILDEYVVSYDYRQPRREFCDVTASIELAPVALTGAVSETLEEVTLGQISLDSTTPGWEPATAYSVGDFVFWNNRRYQCLVAHTSGSTFAVTVSGTTRWQIVTTDSSPLADSRRFAWFNTTRGRRTIENAAMRLGAFLRFRARCLTLKFDLPLSDGFGLSCRHTVNVAWNKLPGGSATGKVIEVSHSVRDGSGMTSVTLGISVGTGTAPTPGAGYTAVPEDTRYSLRHQQLSTPYRPVDVDQLGTDFYAVTDKRLQNGRFVQESAMASSYDADLNAVDPQRALEQTPTLFSFELRNLSPTGVLLTRYASDVWKLSTVEGIEL
jgi:hypothetical protein